MTVALAWMLAALLAGQDVAGLDPRVGAPERSLAREARARLEEANLRESEAWRAVGSREAWERYRDRRIQALRASLGPEPPATADLRVRVMRTIEGEGYRIDNLVFESRPGLVVTANLYEPAAPPSAMPGLVVCHSHHTPKTQGELQALGITWARQGCRVLVMDQLGHGERRQHPFADAASHPSPFRVGRQDYYFRHVVGIQLHLAGESLIGWMAWDLRRGIDLLLSRPGTDPARIALLGAVAGGGDPCAVAAALDPRVAAAVPFNFGGPQPETVHPLPEDAETSFNYAGSGSWESTRNLRLSARDGFLPWGIVGSLAPRGLVYAHEFAWDRERDPVWRRFERIWGLYGAGDRLAATHGRGRLSGRPPEASHCTHIGAEHLKGVHPAFERWLGIPTPERMAAERRPAEELACATADVRMRPARALLAEKVSTLVPPPREALRMAWARLLGPCDPAPAPAVERTSKERRASFEVERLVVGDVPVLLLHPGGRAPVVVGLAQDGKAGFLRHRAGPVEALLEAGVAVVLPDLRGTGENGPLGGRGRSSASTAHAATELMLGRTLVGLRLGDLRTVLAYLRARPDVDPARIGLWGDSFAPANPPEPDPIVPLEADRAPVLAEPLGDLLALLGALFEPDVKAVATFGGLASFAGLLDVPCVHVPADVVVPGLLSAGDLDTLAAAPRRVRREGRVDGLNRRVDAGASPDPSGWLASALKR